VDENVYRTILHLLAMKINPRFTSEGAVLARMPWSDLIPRVIEVLGWEQGARLHESLSYGPPPLTNAGE
jgi:hypothetical protein